MRYLLRSICTVALLTPATLAGQEQALVEELAPVLSAEDAREWRQDLFQRSLVAPDSVVQRVAAMAAGRIGDLRATPLLARALDESDSTVRVAAAFALGLLRDSAAVQPLIQRLTGVQQLDGPTGVEAITALAKIGGRRVAEFFAAVLLGKVTLAQADPAPVTTQILLETWRLAAGAPSDALLPFTRDTLQTVRWSAVFSLGRLRAPAAAAQMLESLRDPDPATRSLAARALVREYADTAKLPPATVAAVLTRAVDDKDPGVRINALRSLGTYHDSSLAASIAWRVDDPFLNVRVQAAVTLGELGGSAARTTLLRVVEGKGAFALRREALLSLARVDGAEFNRAAATWRASRDWRERAVAAAGWGPAGARDGSWFVSDPDGRVVAAGLEAWAAAIKGPQRSLLDAARRLLTHRDAAVRPVAGVFVARAADLSDLPALTAMFTRSTRDSFPDASIAALNAMLAIRGSGAAAASRVDDEFLRQTPRPTNYVLRRWAEEHWAEAEARWGPSHPIET